MRRCLPILVMLTGVTLLGPIQPRPMAMERHPGAPSMIIGEGSSQERCEFRDFSHADKKSPAAIEAFAIPIRVGRDRLDSPNAAARLIARIEPRLGGDE